MNARGETRDDTPGNTREAALDEIEALITTLEELQAKKVIDLARRLKPGLTAEDIKNPHDFPELDDNDWHYEDGMLTGIQSVLSAIRARRSEGRHDARDARDANEDEARR